MSEIMQPDLLPDDAHARRAAARFFIRIGQTGRASAERDPFTAQLFPLPLILQAEGLLAQGLEL